MSEIDRLRLIRTPGIGPITWRLGLIARFGDAARALEALPDLARRGGGKAPTLPDPRTIEREMKQVASLGARYLFLGDADYPPLLAELGECAARDRRARRRRAGPPPDGRHRWRAQRLRRRLPLRAGTGARSGARGRGGRLRSRARNRHRRAHGRRPRHYRGDRRRDRRRLSPENAALQERIAEEALLIAEMPPGTEPRARHFPHRNRIIAGIAAGTVIVEAAPKSGSLITARLANEAGREVMAVPGSPLDPRAQGCNLLIREGAILVQNAADVLEQIRPIDPRAVRAPGASFGSAPPADADDAARLALTGLLGPVPVMVDELVRQSGLAPAVVQIVLLELELAGRLERHAGARVSLI